MKNYGEITINEYTLSIIHFFHFSTPELWGCWGTPWTCFQSIIGLTQTTIHTQIHQYSQIRVNTEPMSLDCGRRVPISANHLTIMVQVTYDTKSKSSIKQTYKLNPKLPLWCVESMNI